VRFYLEMLSLGNIGTWDHIYIFNQLSPFTWHRSQINLFS
jgi:hypothetical protein